MPYQNSRPSGLLQSPILWYKSGTPVGHRYCPFVTLGCSVFTYGSDDRLCKCGVPALDVILRIAGASHACLAGCITATLALSPIRSMPVPLSSHTVMLPRRPTVITSFARMRILDCTHAHCFTMQAGHNDTCVIPHSPLTQYAASVIDARCFTMQAGHTDALESDIRAGMYDLIYLTPEKLALWRTGVTRLNEGPGILASAALPEPRACCSTLQSYDNVLRRKEHKVRCHRFFFQSARPQVVHLYYTCTEYWQVQLCVNPVYAAALQSCTTMLWQCTV